MEIIYKELKRILNRVRVRCFNKNLIKNTTIMMVIAGIAGIMLEVCARLVPVYEVNRKALYVMLVMLVVTFIYTAWKFPKLHFAAKKVDSFGLQERVTTALEIKDSNSIYKDLVIKDAFNSIKDIDYKKHLKLMPSKRIIVVLSAVLLIFSITLLMPEPLKGRAAELHKLSIYKNKVSKKIAKSEKSVNKNKRLSTKDKKELLKRLEELRKDIKKQKTSSEARRLVRKYSEKLQLRKKESSVKDMKQLEESIKNNSDLKQLSSAIRSGNSRNAKKALDKLKQKMKSMSASEKKRLAKALKKAAKMMKNKKLSQKLLEAASAINSNDYGLAINSIDGLSATISDSMNNDSENAAIDSILSSLYSGDLKNKDSLGSSTGSKGINSAGSSASGKGKAGGGAGSGTSNKDGGTNSYGGIITHKKTSGNAGERNYEKIYDPSVESRKTSNERLNGKSGKGSSESYDTANGNTQAGDYKAYNQVVGKYEKKAMKSLENSDIPEGMKELIKGYFDSLNN